MEFAEKTILITGGGGEIGAGLAHAFAQEGAATVMVDTSEEAAQAAADDLKHRGWPALAVRGDVSIEEDCRQTVAAAVREFGGVDVLINNAGISGLVAPVTEMDLASWNTTMAVNVTGAMLMSREVLNVMIPRKHGNIINVSSHVGKRGIPFRSPYVASKFALIGLTQVMALEVARFGIRVNAICPGPVEGKRIQRSMERAASVRGVSVEVVQREWVEDSPMKRFVTAQEVAAVAVFLASSRATAMTGQAINITAGRIMF